MGRQVVGVDIGGTNISAAVVNEHGEVFSSPITVPTQANEDPAIVVRNICDAIDNAIKKAGLDRSGLDGIGLGIPTTLDNEGRLIDSRNLPTLGGKNLAKLVSDSFNSLEVITENDANCFIIGEAEFGSARECDYACGVTLGTGLGIGLLLEGKLYRGSSGSAGEIFPSPYKKENLESILSGPGVSNSYYEKTGKNVTAREISKRATRGEDAAEKIWHDFGRALGYLLSYIVNLLDLRTVVIGGSLSKANDLFLDSSKAVLAQYVPVSAELNLTNSELGEQAGVIGAASLLF